MSASRTEFRHAINPPRFERSKIHRARLVDRIRAEIGKRLIVLVAPPGFGKTTLLADFIQHTEIPAAWAQISSADLDPMHFARLLTESLTKRFRRLTGKIRLDSLGNAPPKALARAILAPLDRLLPETFVLVLDDAHILNDSGPALELLDTLLLEGPSQLTVLLGGRDLPDISMARLVVDSEMAGLGTDALAFTEEETIELALLNSKPAPASADLARLMDQTRGWAAGIVLSLKIAGGDARSLLSGRPMVYEYLGSVAFEGQEPGLREFMLAAAVLPVMTAQSCDDLLQVRDSQANLTRLVRRGLFVTALDLTPRSYMFHPQFREFLLQTAELEQPHRLRILRIRAARFLEKDDQPQAAFQILIEAEAFTEASELAGRHAYELFATGRSATLEMWADALLAHGGAPVNLHLLLATALSDRTKLEQAARHLAIAEESLQKRGDEASRRELIQAANIKGWLAYRTLDLERAASSLAAVESMLDDSIDMKARASHLRLKALTSAALNEDRELVLQRLQEALDMVRPVEQFRHMQALLLLDILHLQAESGDLKEARHIGEEALAILRELGSPDALATCVNDLAVLAHLEGRFFEALDLFQKASQHAHQAANPAKQINVTFGQADLFCDLGQPWQAGELYGEGLTVAGRIPDQNLLQYGFLATSVLHRRWGTRELAHEWLERANELDPPDGPPPARAVQAAALEIDQDPRTGVGQLRDLLSARAVSLSHVQKQLALYMLSRAHFKLGQDEDALRALELALDECLLAGSIQPIAAELFADPGFLDFLCRALPDHALLPAITSRIDSMQTISRNLHPRSILPSEVAALELRALGGSEIFLNGERVADLEPLPRQVLIFLVDAGPVARDLILEAIWPGIPEERQVASLYTATHSLRKALGDSVLQIEGSMYRLNPALNIVYDVAVFEHAASLAKAALPGDPRRYFALTEAINAFCGPFLPEMSADWSVRRRDELDRRLLELLANHAEAALALGREERALESLRRAVGLAPLRDDLNLRYLELLGLLGRRDELSAHYRRYTQLLADELGLDPPLEAQELYNRLIS